MNNQSTATEQLSDEEYQSIVWDGKLHSYRPSPSWREQISPKLKLYSKVDEDLDPVTFEVLRNRLWMINMAHGETLTRISGSPIFQALDFNVTILAEDGELVMNAPFLQYLNAGAPLVIRYVLENYSEAPAIEDGDMFLANDPWVGAAHQMDVCIACPVFIDGKLFAWVSNAGHQYDLGGIVPGGWPQNAVDVHYDPVLLTPFKIVEQGTLRSDLEQMYLRHSRMPDLVALDLRAQLAGCRYAAQSIKEACEEFGAPTVKAAMRRILDQAQEAFANKLSRVPDGKWTDIRYLDEKLPGDRLTHPIQVNVEKQGNRLIVDNIGSEAQSEGPCGFTYVNFSGGFVGVLSVTMLYEHTFSIGGAERQIEFRPTPGLLNCCDHPAAVSGGVTNVLAHMYSVMNIVGRMLACDPERKRDIIVGGAEWPLLVLAGLNDRGEYFGTGFMDTSGFGSGARSYKDGVDTGGPSWNPLMRVPNVEEAEQSFPVLYLYRRELKDSGGAGRWRGGVGLEYAVTPYRAGNMESVTNSGGMTISTFGAMGLFGGYPSPSVRFEVIKNSDVHDFFARREMPRDVNELSADKKFKLRAKSNGTSIDAGDVILGMAPGGGGYGDPMEREPSRVVKDVALGYVSGEAARDVYGVVINESGEADEAATSELRERILTERRAWPNASQLLQDRSEPAPLSTPASNEPSQFVHEYVVARDEGEFRVLACSRCDHVLGDYRAEFKLGLLVHEGSATQIPTTSEPSEFLDEKIVFRRFCCPGCQLQMAVEIVREGEPFVPEMMFA